MTPRDDLYHPEVGLKAAMDELSLYHPTISTQFLALEAQIAALKKEIAVNAGATHISELQKNLRDVEEEKINFIKKQTELTDLFNYIAEAKKEIADRKKIIALSSLSGEVVDLTGRKVEPLGSGVTKLLNTAALKSIVASATKSIFSVVDYFLKGIVGTYDFVKAVFVDKRKIDSPLLVTGVLAAGGFLGSALTIATLSGVSQLGAASIAGAILPGLGVGFAAIGLFREGISLHRARLAVQSEKNARNKLLQDIQTTITDLDDNDAPINKINQEIRNTEQRLIKLGKQYASADYAKADSPAKALGFHSVRHEITDAKEQLNSLREKRIGLIESNPRIQRLRAQVKQHEARLKTLRARRGFSWRRVGLGILSTLAVIAVTAAIVFSGGTAAIAIGLGAAVAIGLTDTTLTIRDRVKERNEQRATHQNTNVPVQTQTPTKKPFTQDEAHLLMDLEHGNRERAISDAKVKHHVVNETAAKPVQKQSEPSSQNITPERKEKENEKEESSKTQKPPRPSAGG